MGHGNPPIQKMLDLGMRPSLRGRFERG
jgi:hypothetical protein